MTNSPYLKIKGQWDYPDFYFFFPNGSQDCPNFHAVEIDWDWD